MGSMLVADCAAGCSALSQTYAGVCSTSYAGQTSATPRCWCTGGSASSETGATGDANVDLYEARAGEPGGMLSVSVSVPNINETFTTVDYTITGPDGPSTIVGMGSAYLGAGPTLFVIGLPPGSNYRIAFTATSNDGTVTCSGSAPFTIESRMTTGVTDTLQCAGGPPSSTPVDSGPSQDCATWTTAMANPAETTVGNSVVLTATATGPNPNELGYWWSAPSGTFSTPGASSTSFTCMAAGIVVVTLTVTDGSVAAGQPCNPPPSTTMLQVTCDNPLDASDKPLDASTGG
jgi:hypothetical protein